MILPSDKQYNSMVVNRMPVYFSTYNQQNCEEQRTYLELKGHTHAKLKESLKEVFEIMIVNLSKMKQNLSKSQKCINSHIETSNALSEVDTNV